MKRKVTGENGKTYLVKEKKPFYKRGWFIILAIFIVLGGIGNALSDSTPSAENPSTAKSSTQTHKVTVKENTPETTALGDVASIGKMSYKVYNQSYSKKVGNAYLKTEATGIYYVLSIAARNNSTEAVTVDTSGFKIINNGKTYSADAEATMQANQANDGSIKHSFFLESLNPDQVMHGYIVFDAPFSVLKSSSRQLEVSNGFLDYKKGTMELN